MDGRSTWVTSGGPSGCQRLVLAAAMAVVIALRLIRQPASRLIRGDRSGLGRDGRTRELAAALAVEGHDVVTSLAGRVRDPALPLGRLRIGGFGGVDGLADYCVRA